MSLKPEDAEDRSGLQEGGFADIDGDGALEFLQPADDFGTEAEPDYPNLAWTILKLDRGEFRATPMIVPFFGTFLRESDKPYQGGARFAAVPGAYTLRLTTGDAGSPVVTSAVVRLNETVVVGSSKFDGTRRLVEAPVTLRAKNQILVELRGQPGSILNVAILRAD